MKKLTTLKNLQFDGTHVKVGSLDRGLDLFGYDPVEKGHPVYSLANGQYFSLLAKKDEARTIEPVFVNLMYVQFDPQARFPYVPVETQGFLITDKGDWSVGVRDAEFDLKGPFSFDSFEDLDIFRQKLREAFEYAADNPVVTTYEEDAIEREEQEEGMTPQPGWWDNTALFNDAERRDIENLYVEIAIAEDNEQDEEVTRIQGRIDEYRRRVPQGYLFPVIIDGKMQEITFVDLHTVKDGKVKVKYKEPDGEYTRAWIPLEQVPFQPVGDKVF